jgi:WD repeat-containing protein 59
MPLSRIVAHSSKIYGIDWSHVKRHEIITCSLDKSIKFWDTDIASHGKGNFEALRTINTMYPVWRARSLPFGNGVLSLPQRGETALEMWTYDGDGEIGEGPLEIFEGHLDVVKEFVWRKGGHGAHQDWITQLFVEIVYCRRQ